MRLIVFDLDGTLAESKSNLDAEMSGLLHDLLGAVRGGSDFGRGLAAVRGAAAFRASR